MRAIAAEECAVVPDELAHFFVDGIDAGPYGLSVLSRIGHRDLTAFSMADVAS